MELIGGEGDPVKPYYQDELVTLYHGDCRDVLPSVAFDVLMTDPPYPNNAGHFTDSVDLAEAVLLAMDGISEALVFWTELDRPAVGRLPLVAVHVWHRTNVNGRPYEPIYHFCLDGVKRRSNVFAHAAVFDGAGPGCNEYQGHPTQKPEPLMRRLISKAAVSDGVICDPFAGSGTTGVAAKRLSRQFVGIEINEAYCEIAARRLSQGTLSEMFQ